MENVTKYRKYKNILNSCLKQAEENFYQNIFSEKHKGIAHFWKAFGETLNAKKKKTNYKLQKLIIENQVVTDENDIVNGLNNYFCSIGQKLSSQIPTTAKHFESYLRNEVHETFFLAPVMAQEVSRHLKSLHPRKSHGPDNLLPQIIKTCAHQFTTPLTMLFNKSIQNGKFPDLWKLVKILALYKKKSRFQPENYRPISLLNCFSKVLEKLIFKQMIAFMETHKILYDFQYGFRKNHSTALALIDIVDKITFALNENEYALGIFLDITKAFDSINHNILLTKLQHYGFRGHSSNFIKSYLTGRKQFLGMQGHISDIKTIAYGVPQGSVLGPLLFLLCINDIQHAATNTHLRLFADDTAIFTHDKNVIDLMHQGTGTMKKIVEWFMTNRLSLSLGKSNFVLFHGRRKDSHEEIQTISIGQDEIPRVTQFKYIGLTLDENLTWEPHINNICSALVRYYSIFYNVRNSITSNIARAIYYICIYPHISYAIEIYGSANDTLISKLQVQPNKLLKLLTKRDYRYSTNKLHQENRILKVKHIHELYTLACVFRCHKDTPIEPFKDYFKRRDETHEYELRNNENLSTNKICLNTGKTTTHTTGALLWNNCPTNITDLNEIGPFKKVCSKIIFRCTKTKLSSYTTYYVSCPRQTVE